MLAAECKLHIDLYRLGKVVIINIAYIYLLGSVMECKCQAIYLYKVLQELS